MCVKDGENGEQVYFCQNAWSMLGEHMENVPGGESVRNNDILFGVQYAIWVIVCSVYSEAS